MKQLHIGRAGRKQQVYNTMYALQRSFTMYEIAEFLHMAPSSHLNKMLLEMVDEGDLAFYEVAHRPNRTKRLFYLRALAAPLQQLALAV